MAGYYLSTINTRLRDAGFNIRRDVKFKHSTFAYVAWRTNFRVERFGRSRTEVIFANFDTPDMAALKRFSGDAYRLTNRTYGFFPPYGFGYATECFPVAVVGSVGPDIIEAVEAHDPPKHWGAFECLAIFNKTTQKLHHYQTKPFWGSLYHEQIWAFIDSMLAP